MKRAYVLAMQTLEASIALGMCHPVLWVHDEVQFAVEPTHAELVGTTMAECITQAGVDLGLRLRLGADYKVGNTWAETH
jgi:DNA polymerase I-like protein with 3'-5' exonuclease and polymerase domains